MKNNIGKIFLNKKFIKIRNFLKKVALSKKRANLAKTAILKFN